MAFLDRAGLAFGRWVRQAPYLPWCGALASTPHRKRLAEMTAEGQYAAIELFRGTMVRHAVVAYRKDRSTPGAPVDFDGEAWPSYRPIRSAGHARRAGPTAAGRDGGTYQSQSFL